MIDFMVLGAPRSATTWMANLLTTDTTICFHDPLLEYTRAFLDQMVIPGKRIGISCTSSLMWPEWLAKHPARKIILYRDPAEVNESLERLGLAAIDPELFRNAVQAQPNDVWMYKWDSVFRGQQAEEICKRLHVPFCAYRHFELSKMNVQPQMNRLPLDPSAVKELVDRFIEISGVKK